MNLLPAAVDVERRHDGTLVLRSPAPIAPYRRCLGEHLEYWANHKPDGVFLSQRQGEGWRSITFGEAHRLVRAVASSLLKRGLSAERPIAILSENSI